MCVGVTGNDNRREESTVNRGEKVSEYSEND